MHVLPGAARQIRRASLHPTARGDPRPAYTRARSPLAAPDRRAPTRCAPGGIRMTAWLAVLSLLLVTAPAHAEVTLPPGFTTEVYVTGQGFDTSGERGVTGIP